MKIGFVRRGYSATGGAEAYLLRLAHAVAEQAHSPVLITSKEWPEDAWPNEFVIRLAGSTPAAFAEEVERCSVECDVILSLERIVSCDVYRAGDGVHRAWLERRAAFEPLWRRFLREMNPKHRDLLRLEEKLFAGRGARMVIANSEMVREEIVRIYGYPADRIAVIPNGYDAPPLQPDLREQRRAELGISPGAFVALFAGSGWERKGLSLAISAIESLPEAILLVAGRGKSAKFAHTDRVRFLGPRKDLQADFAAADVFVLPTIYDPFSNACLEAWAAGLPVLTTNANGFADALTEGEDGSIFAPGDGNALIAALHSWNSAGRARAARAICSGRARRYSVAENTRRTLDLITSATRR